MEKIGMFHTENNGCRLVLDDHLVEQEELEQALNTLSEGTIEKVSELVFSELFFLEELPGNLDKFRSLKTLRISNCPKLKKLDGLEKLHLTTLIAEQCLSLTNLDGIKNLPLKHLDLSHDLSLENFEVLESFAKTLQYLSVEGMPRFKPDHAKCLKCLKHLNFTHLKSN